MSDVSSNGLWGLFYYQQLIALQRTCMTDLGHGQALMSIYACVGTSSTGMRRS